MKISKSIKQIKASEKFFLKLVDKVVSSVDFKFFCLLKTDLVLTFFGNF